MSGPVPFPGGAPSSLDFASADSAMRIDIPRSKEESASHHKRHTSNNGASKDEKQQQQQQQHSLSGFQHHPRQPGPQSESYFSGAPSQPRTPGGGNLAMRGHARHVSSTGNPGLASAAPMSLNLSDSAHADGAGGIPYSFHGGGPPSPSTLTDNILGLHSTLYAGKHKPEEVREMVWRYYERGAVFESPLLSAHGRDQIANQFMMAFALPGMEVRSELRDVICSDFEFDGTRAGIIDHTITVTFFPSLFGSSPPADPESNIDDVNRTPRGPFSAAPGPGASGFSANPITPHPFADYGGQSATWRQGGQSAYSHPHSPTTPFSISSMWGNSRPHTPGHPTTAGIRPLSGTVGATHTPPSVNGEDLDGMAGPGSTTHLIEADSAGGHVTRPAIPADALQPHWSAEGLGRNTFRGILWSLFHPRAALKSLCSIQLRVMSRLEFNDAGLIVRHEDTWGLRETIEGVIPFASLIYAIERRVVGFLVSWTIGRGLRLSSVLLNKAINGPFSSLPPSDYKVVRRESDHPQAHEAAKALLERSYPATSHPSMFGHRQPRDFYTISRSRAPSPNRFRFGTLSGSQSGTVTGTRSRARSLVGSQAMTPSMRAMSTDNLAMHFGTGAAMQGGGSVQDAGTYRRSMDLPPDSGAKFRERSAKRLEGGRASSTNSAPPTTCDPSDLGPAGNLVNMWEQFSNHSSRAASVAEDRVPSRAPDQDQQ